MGIEESRTFLLDQTALDELAVIASGDYSELSVLITDVLPPALTPRELADIRDQIPGASMFSEGRVMQAIGLAAMMVDDQVTFDNVRLHLRTCGVSGKITSAILKHAAKRNNV